MKCELTNCKYWSATGCAFFIVEGMTRTALHEEEGVDINDPCREYTPGERVLLNRAPFMLGRDLL